ncbi:CocE/NonD family hydrolase [Mumia sp. ZJ1417]|uniref:CocE/NonD family hydrolase n=1 Tax=Mumia sp. ZJ1417 TaxID=2708082 RepID=UPI00142457D5|nr:CocE/NonD family hydrolase [Mumia sp. ZJ1417]QMW64846.1 CocE/NonD family hydrolase [Mumia sp. ZJ1417]
MHQANVARRARTSRTGIGLLLTLTLTGTALVAGTATTAFAAPAAKPYVLQGGVSAPVYDYADAIRETVWVIAPDFDGDGEKDKIAADIVRPRELDTRGVDVPIVMDASPYYTSLCRGNESECKTFDAEGNLEKFPLFYDNYFVPRGYAYVAADVAGTSRSNGCVDTGGKSDIGSIKAVVEWLNGNAEAVDAAGNPVEADWSNGKTGMIGKSYDGTIANGVAATGVKGLETIVPISAISSWYDYSRSQGLPYSWNYSSGLAARVATNRTQPQDCSATLQRMNDEDADETGEHNAFWDERNYRDAGALNAEKVKASVFIYHGLQDTNVKTRHFSTWWEELGNAGVIRKMWLSRVGHVDPFDIDRDEWVSTLHRWFDHELMGIKNTILREPRVSVETKPNHWVDSHTWPARLTTTTLRPQADGGLRLLPAKGSQTWVNSASQRENAAVAEGANANRLLYATNPLLADARMSGSLVAKLRVTSEVPTGQVGVMLVDYGEAERVLTTGDGASTTTTETCTGESTPADDGCYFTMARNVGTTPLQILGRGWARLDGAGTHDVTVTLDPDDAVVKKGHRLGVVVVGAANGRVRNIDTTASTYSLDLTKSSFALPGLALPQPTWPAGWDWLPKRSDLAPSGERALPALLDD